MMIREIDDYYHPIIVEVNNCPLIMKINNNLALFICDKLFSEVSEVSTLMFPLTNT